MVVSLALPAAALAQEQLSPEEQAINQLVNQYATVTLGYRINQRCNQLYPKAAEVFGENQKILDAFMTDFLTVEAYRRLNEGLVEAGEDEVANPCGPETFDFVQAAAQIASTMAYRVQVLNGVEEPEPVAAPAPAAVEQPPQTEVQPDPPPAMESQPEPAAEPQPVAEPAMEPAIEPEPEPEPEPAVQPATQPKPMVTEPKPEPARAGPRPGESKKEMKARQREEILELRRAQRAEMDAFKERQDSYPDPKAAKKAIEDRHEAEFDQMRERHYREQQENKG